MRRLFPTLILVFAVSSLLIFLLGDSGLLARNDLAVYREQLAANVASLEARQADLESRLARLRSDPDTVRVLARGQGLYEPGEAVVRLEGAPSRPDINAVGDLLKYHGGPEARNAVIKTAGVGLSIALIAWALLQSTAARRRAHAGPGR
jgi:cell division protein FtsB